MSWTVQPANPTKAIKGKDISLGWDFFLNSTELTQSQTYYTIIWKKFNASTLSYSPVGSLSIPEKKVRPQQIPAQFLVLSKINH